MVAVKNSNFSFLYIFASFMTVKFHCHQMTREKLSFIKILKCLSSGHVNLNEYSNAIIDNEALAIEIELHNRYKVILLAIYCLIEIFSIKSLSDQVTFPRRL